MHVLLSQVFTFNSITVQAKSHGQEYSVTGLFIASMTQSLSTKGAYKKI